KTSISKGRAPATRAVPIKVMTNVAAFIFVKGSLKKIKDKIMTKAGPVYNKAVAIGIVDNSMAVNIQKLKKTILKRPVPIKYLISVGDLSFKLCLEANNI